MNGKCLVGLIASAFLVVSAGCSSKEQIEAPGEATLAIEDVPGDEGAEIALIEGPGHCWVRCCGGEVERPEGVLDANACIDWGQGACSQKQGTQRIRLEGHLIASFSCD